jgi:hypothetical protein
VLALSLVACAAVLAACGTGNATSAGGAGSAIPGGSDPSAATASFLMTGPQSGLLVWSSGSAWLVLGTTDGFRDVTDATPPAVPTDGGLVLSRDGSREIVGVRTTGALTVSPFLLGDGTRAGWTGSQLPGALGPGPDVVSLHAGTVSAVVGSGSAGRLVESTDGGATWTVSATPGSLDPTGRLELGAVAWTDPAHGWLAGSAPEGRPALYATRSGADGWQAVALATAGSSGSSGTETVSTPCLDQGTLVVLVAIRAATGSGRAVVERSSDGGTTWLAGAPVPFSGGPPVPACGSGQVWLAVPNGSASRLLISGDGGLSWSGGTATPGPVVALSVTGPGDGYAVTGRGASARLWTVGAGTVFTRLPLPSWVAKLSIGDQS